MEYNKRLSLVNRAESVHRSGCFIEVKGNKISLQPPSLYPWKKDFEQPKEFAFDQCLLKSNEKLSVKETFQDLGKEIWKNISQGYNSCFFAFRKTGSGKSFSLLKVQEEPSLVSLICSELFCHKESGLKVISIKGSFTAIYDKEIMDLVPPHGLKNTVDVCSYVSFEPFADGLSQHFLNRDEDIKFLITAGNNQIYLVTKQQHAILGRSSLAHLVFTLIITYRRGKYKLCNKLILVDLAESKGIKPEESNTDMRDSVLSCFLSQCLVGKTKATIVAMIDPRADNYKETLSTLSSAQKAKCIVTQAMRHEDSRHMNTDESQEELRKQTESLSLAEGNRSKTEESVNPSMDALDIAVIICSSRTSHQETTKNQCFANYTATSVRWDLLKHFKSDMEASREITSYIRYFRLDNWPKSNLGYKRVLLQLFGFMGHGKSSFINTCKCVLDGMKYQNYMRSSYISRISYPLTDTLILVDNRGCPTMNDYKTGDIFAQLANLLPLDEVVWTKGYRLRERIMEAEKKVQSSDFIIPIFVYSVKNGLVGELVPEMKKFLEIAGDLTEIFPVVVLTHKTQGDLTDVKTKFKNMGVKQIFAIDNITPEDQVKTRERHEDVLKFFCEVLNDIQLSMETMGDPEELREKRKMKVLTFLHDREWEEHGTRHSGCTMQ